MQITKIIGISIVFLMAISFSICAASIAETINFQGVLTFDGLPVDKTVLVTLSVYDSESGEIPLWTRRQNIEVINGIYNFKTTSFPDSLSVDREYYLAVEIETQNGPICLGRKRLVSYSTI
ncbi:MAG: hypothetical protein JSW20_11245 [Nitrospiraceae bacterium]|nr:MAG: hypothetical protein JSW20_11245 [Nitrospiraceae bacterium]